MDSLPGYCHQLSSYHDQYWVSPHPMPSLGPEVANRPKWIQLLWSLCYPDRLRNVALYHRHLPHPLHLGSVARPWMGDIQVAAGRRFRVACLWHVPVQRLDPTATQEVCRKEA